MQEAVVVRAAKMQVKEWRGNFNVGFEHDLTSTERGIAGGKYVSEYKDDGMGWLLLKKMVMKNYEDKFDCGSDHEILIDKFRLKLKKVGKTTRLFRSS